MAIAVFWISLVCLTYTYLGYPMLLVARRSLRHRTVRKQPIEPAVTVVVAMHNERKNLQERVENCLDLDYPAEKLQLILSLDAPTDGTDALAAGYQYRGVEVVHCPVRHGKAVALNRGVAAATGEIVVFADARQRFDRQAIRELVANFADESVGAVSGELMLLSDDGTEAAEAVGLYWRYEKKIRAIESSIHSIPGVTGAIHAMRRELFQPLKPGTILDDVAIPMRIVLGGRRAVLDTAARAYDVVSKNPESEYEKKRRTLAGNYQLLVEMPELLLPWRNPIFVQFVSHKVFRLLAPYCMAALLVSNLFLRSGFYRAALIAQVIWYALAYSGWLASTRNEVPRHAAARSAYDEQV